jgi:uncharacterized RDD family membrane protein YckC
MKNSLIIKRFLAFIFDFAFITLIAFVLFMLVGLIIPIDTDGYQNLMIVPLIIILIFYLFLGEIIFRDTLGKYLFGIEVVDKESMVRPSLLSLCKRGLLKIIFPVEGLVILLSKSKRRLGDFWAKTIVINKETNKLKSSVRLIIGLVVLIVLVFCFRISMGLAVKKTDFYNVGISYLQTSGAAKITGLPKVVNQTRNTVNFIVPVSNENRDKYVIIYLEKNGGVWEVNHTGYIKEHIIGFAYGFSTSSSK